MTEWKIRQLNASELTYLTSHAVGMVRIEHENAAWDVMLEDENPEDPNVEEHGPCPFRVHQIVPESWGCTMCGRSEEVWRDVEESSGLTIPDAFRMFATDFMEDSTLLAKSGPIAVLNAHTTRAEQRKGVA